MQVMLPKSRASATSSVWTALCRLVKQLGGESRMCSAAFALCRALRQVSSHAGLCLKKRGIVDLRERGTNPVHQQGAFGG